MCLHSSLCGQHQPVFQFECYQILVLFSFLSFLSLSFLFFSFLFRLFLPPMFFLPIFIFD